MGKNIEQQIPRQGELFPGLRKASIKPLNETDFLTPDGKPKGWEPRKQREKKPVATMPVSRSTTSSEVSDNGGSKASGNQESRQDRYTRWINEH